jgi:hypothetical protein
VGHCRASTKMRVQHLFESCGPMYTFVGKATQAHRVFVLSADTFFEGGAFASPQCKPWCTSPLWTPTADLLLEFVVQQAGPGDVRVVCDGRSEQCRDRLEEYINTARNVNEMWAVYKPFLRLCRSASFSADTREIWWIDMRVNRTLISAKVRTAFNSSWISSTGDLKDTGVNQVQ